MMNHVTCKLIYKDLITTQDLLTKLKEAMRIFFQSDSNGDWPQTRLNIASNCSDFGHSNIVCSKYGIW